MEVVWQPTKPYKIPPVAPYGLVVAVNYPDR